MANLTEPMSDTLAVAVAPDTAGPWISAAVGDGGGQVVPPERASALIWGGHGPNGLGEVLQEGPHITWVQLPSAGIETYRNFIDDGRTWTCAKGIYGVSVAEHALALALAGIHHLPQLARRRAWQRAPCRDLYGGSVTVVGAGGITRALLDFLAPFHATTTVVRRHVEGLPGAARVLPTDHLQEALKDADVVILALALTPETEGIIGEDELRAMQPNAWLVNVGRGKLVNTDALVTALREGWIGGAALDVTDPEPLPEGHALWDLDNCLITPHCANPPDLEHERYAALIRENVRRRAEGKPLEGLVDPSHGY